MIVHCTITRQQVLRTGYLAEFARFWSERSEVSKIWFSLFTPQAGNDSAERLTNDDRSRALAELANLAPRFRNVHLPQQVLDGYRRPPVSPAECIFAQSTWCQCGCLASAGMTAIGRYKLAGIVPVADLFSISSRLGEQVRRFPAAARPLPENRPLNSTLLTILLLGSF